MKRSHGGNRENQSKKGVMETVIERRERGEEISPPRLSVRPIFLEARTPVGIIVARSI